MATQSPELTRLSHALLCRRVLCLEDCDHNLHLKDEVDEAIWFKKVDLQERQQRHDLALATVVQAQEAAQQVGTGILCIQAFCAE